MNHRRADSEPRGQSSRHPKDAYRHGNQMGRVHQSADHTSNENKMSDGGRGRASLGVEVWKSSQKWSAQRSAVRSIAWLDCSGASGYQVRKASSRSSACMALQHVQRIAIATRIYAWRCAIVSREMHSLPRRKRRLWGRSVAHWAQEIAKHARAEARRRRGQWQTTEQTDNRWHAGPAESPVATADAAYERDEPTERE